MGNKIKNYAGQTIGGRVIDSLSHQNQRGVAYWKWHCIEHPKIVQAPLRVSKSLLRYGPMCCRKSAGADNPHWSGFMSLTGHKIAGIKHNAKKRNIHYDISMEYLWNLWTAQEQVCAYTGRYIDSINTASLDRIDSAVGYVEGNVEWVHKDVNLAKQRLSKADFIQLCDEVSKNGNNYSGHSNKTGG